MTEQINNDFLGTWVLDTATCDYQQGDPHWSDTHRIERDSEQLVFTMDWTDGDGETHHASFRAKPDGSKIPFNGGPLADTLQVSAPSENELTSSAFFDGVELMTATRTLDDDGDTMHVVQTVHLPDGTSPTNRGTYYREE